MAGSGTFTVFGDKERIGVYQKFDAKKASDFISPATTGIGAYGITMDRYEEGKVTELFASDLESGACLSTIGYTLADEAILPYRLGLTGAYKGYFYPLNKGGVKASGSIGDITISDKKNGISGNEIKVVITANTPTAGKFAIEVYFKGVKKETKYVTTFAELQALKSDWVVFSSSIPSPTITGGNVTLSGGTNGSIVETSGDGTKAFVSIGSLKFETKNAGEEGNKIGITISENSTESTKYDLAINVDGTAQETYSALAGVSEFVAISSSLVTITNPSGTTITTATDTKLTGGVNPTTSSYDDFFTAVKYKMYDYIAIASADASVSDKVVEFVNKQIANKGKFVCGVVYNKPMLNNKYIISVDQGLECEDFTITTALMPIFVASLRAGCPLGECLDNHDMTTLIGAKKIINPVNDDDDTEIITALKQGRFLFTYWNDGTVVVEEDLNTFVEYTENDPQDYRRNRLIATMNYIGNEANLRLNKNVVDGKHADDDEGNTRYLVKSIVDDICSELKRAVVIGNYDPQTDITVGAVENSTDKLYYDTFLKYKDSIRQIYGHYNIVLG